MPTLQAAQSDTELEPVNMFAVPIGQALQLLIGVVSPYLPDGQAEQLEAPLDENEPNGHVTHETLEEAPVTLLYVPNGQLTQDDDDVEPVLGLYRPVGHRMHEPEPGEDAYRPD